MSHQLLKPEQQARQQIDRLLTQAGWVVQSKSEMNLSASLGVAVREFQTPDGFADYVLFVDRKAVCVVEAKPEGVTLGLVAEQSRRYRETFPENVPHVALPLPIAYESTGTETYFYDVRDPEPRSRRVFAFHRPETFKAWLEAPDTLRARLRALPPLEAGALRTCQVEAIHGLDDSLAENKPRTLIQMATGTGKTYMAVSAIYRLIKFAGARRVLFLVDRSNLGRQTEREFQQYVTPDDGRKFTELYNVQHLQSNTIDPVCRVSISTIQRIYSMLRGTELQEEVDELSAFEYGTTVGQPLEVAYNPAIPIETFDFIFIDETHRSIYNLWRQVLEYFDAFLIGLTATPSKQTFGFFHKNLVMEYPHNRAVADGVNVGFDVYRIKTRISESGSRVDAGHAVIRRDRLTRRERIEQLDEDLEYEATQLDRAVVAPDQIRTVIRAFRDKLFTEIFPGRTTVPKTLIFAKDDNHAEEILHIVREEFNRGNDFAKKITYKTQGAKPEDLIKEFRNSPLPRIVVSVDMIATGTDIRPLECLVFMRDVKSPVYFEQMKGRGTRVIDPTDLKAVTPDAEGKTHFVIVDAVGVTEHDLTDTKPLERKRTVSFEKLLHNVALGIRDEDTLSSLAGRLARLDRTLTPDQRAEIADAAGGTTVNELVNTLLDAQDPDAQLALARERSGTDIPTEEQVKEATVALADAACRPFDDPALRDKIVQMKRLSEITIDNISVDVVTHAGGISQDPAFAQRTVQSFKQFIEEHHDEITALQIFYEQPFGKRHFTLKQIRELAEAIKQPPYQLTPEVLWEAYRRLEADKVRGAGERRLLTDIISLVRHAMEEEGELYPFRELVEERFREWLSRQDRTHRFTAEQMEWLEMIKEHLAASLTITLDDFQLPPFHEHGGRVRAVQLFGKREISGMLDELNEVVAA